MRHRLTIVMAIAAAVFALAGPAYAFDCTVAKKPANAGAVGIVDVTTDQFTPLKRNPGTEEHPHGGFVALTDGQVTTSTFLHAPARSGGVLPPVLEGGPQHNCDGKGLDSIEQCFGQ